MAVTKLTRLKESKKGSRAAHLINNIKYICNLEKTEGGLWIGGNAGQDPSTILTTMLQNKRFWNKEDGSQGFHYVIAFPPLCGINEQTASDFARDFVNKLLGDDYYYVTAVHNDQHHMHVHITFDSVSRTDGMKFHSPQKDWERRIQPITDELCRQYNLPVLEYGEERKGVDYGEWRHKNREDDPYCYTWHDVIRDDIEEALMHSRTLDELKEYLKEEGYEVRDGKYLSLRAPGRQKALRTGRLGKGYSREELISRLESVELLQENKIHDKTYGNRDAVWSLLEQKKKEKKSYKLTPIQRRFYRRWYHTYFLRKPGRRNIRRYREDIVQINRIADALSYLVKKDITDISSLRALERELVKESGNLSSAIRQKRSTASYGIGPGPGYEEELERLKERRSKVRHELKRLIDIRQLYRQEEGRNAEKGARANRLREHTRITIHKKLFGRMDFSEGFLTKIPGRRDVYVLFPKTDCYMYKSGEILSVFLYEEKTYSLCDRDGNKTGDIAGKALKEHYEDKTRRRPERGTHSRKGGQHQ